MDAELDLTDQQHEFGNGMAMGTEHVRGQGLAEAWRYPAFIFSPTG